MGDSKKYRLTNVTGVTAPILALFDSSYAHPGTQDYGNSAHGHPRHSLMVTDAADSACPEDQDDTSLLKINAFWISSLDWRSCQVTEKLCLTDFGLGMACKNCLITSIFS